MKKKTESNKVLQSPRWAPANRPGVTEFIRAAESFVQSGKYAAALEQLARARKLEPENKYILAIMERVEDLHRNPPSPARTIVPEDSIPSSLDSGHYLSITVGNEFEDGIRRETPPAPRSAPFDLIRELTDVARGLAALGHVEPAFNALMRAYLIDPMSPDVIACEATVLPLWNRAHNFDAPPASAMPSAQPVAAPIPTVQHPPSSKRPRSPQDDSQRIEVLKQQKELERLERERAAYRQASGVPRIFKLNPWDEYVSGEPGSEEHTRNFLRRFRGKQS
jgi:hypothetical protein